MPITFENENVVIVYAFEKVLSFARNSQHIFLAQSIWWISSILGLQQGLIIHIDNLKARSESRLGLSVHQPSVSESEPLTTFGPSPNQYIHPDRIGRVKTSEGDLPDSDIESISTAETGIHNEILNNCELFLEQSKQERKVIGRRLRQTSRVMKKKSKKEARRKLKTFGTQTEGIDGSKLRRRKAAGECQRCAWPQDRKGSHRTFDCFRWKRVEKGTAPFPQKNNYNKD